MTVSTNLRDSPQNFHKTSTKIAQKNNTKSWLAKFPNVDWLGQRLWPAVSRRPCAS